MAQLSAGILLYRTAGSGGVDVLLIHPGGPFWAKKDDEAWSIPKGLVEPGEEPQAAARREFAEETGFEPEGPLVELGTFRQPSGKRLAIWACRGDWDPATLKSNIIAIQWPPRSGTMIDIPEADRAGWFTLEAARRKVVRGQRPMLDALLGLLAQAGRRD